MASPFLLKHLVRFERLVQGDACANDGRHIVGRLAHDFAPADGERLDVGVNHGRFGARGANVGDALIPRRLRRPV
jgi:hypothetical protein